MEGIISQSNFADPKQKLRVRDVKTGEEMETTVGYKTSAEIRFDSAKDKAKELYSIFFLLTPQPIKEVKAMGLTFEDWDKDWTIRLAKRCAIVSVDQIMSVIEGVGMDLEWSFWMTVREEIETL